MGRMRSVTPDEVRDAITLVPSDTVGEFGPDGDIENAWDQWGEALRNSETPGTVRVAKIPMDAEGNPQANAKGQIQLGAFPFDQYDYDALLAHIRQKFMKPGETIAVRIMGFTSGSRGVQFNRIVTLQREAPQTHDSGGQSNLGEVLTLMQQSQNAQAQMLREILTPVASASQMPQRNAVESLVDVVTKLGPTLIPLVAAWISRPTKPSSDLKGMIEAMVALQDLRGDGSDRDSNQTMDVIKSVAGPGLQLLTTLAQARNNTPQLPAPIRPRLPPISAPVPNKVDASNAEAVAANRIPVTQSEPEILTPQNNEVPNMAALAQIKEHLKELASLASTTTPDEAATFIMSVIPADVDEQLYNVVSNKVSFAVLLKSSPEALAQKDWFERLRLAILREYEAPDELSGESPPIATN